MSQPLQKYIVIVILNCDENRIKLVVFEEHIYNILFYKMR